MAVSRKDKARAVELRGKMDVLRYANVWPNGDATARRFLLVMIILAGAATAPPLLPFLLGAGLVADIVLSLRRWWQRVNRKSSLDDILAEEFTRRTNISMDYERGLEALRAQLEGTNRYQDFMNYETQLLDNLARENYGSTETIRAERAQIIHRLNRLAMEVLNVSFNDLAANRVPSEKQVSVRQLTLVHQVDGKPTPGSIPPPVRTQVQDLPFNELSWSQFEALCVALIEAQSVTISCNLYGVAGDHQKGVDVVALQRGADGNETWAYQCKRYKEYTPGKLREALDKISYEADFIVLMLSVPAPAALRQVADARANTFLWDAKDISRKMKNYPALVEDFFGPAWRRAFC